MYPYLMVGDSHAFHQLMITLQNAKNPNDAKQHLQQALNYFSEQSGSKHYQPKDNFLIGAAMVLNFLTKSLDFTGDLLDLWTLGKKNVVNPNNNLVEQLDNVVIMLVQIMPSLDFDPKNFEDVIERFLEYKFQYWQNNYTPLGRAASELDIVISSAYWKPIVDIVTDKWEEQLEKSMSLGTAPVVENKTPTFIPGSS